jgi:heme-degrading monooxygenase HmoA
VMYATLIEIDVRGVDRDEGLRGLREGIVPAISAMPGFHSGVWLTTGNDAGLGLSLTVWESEHRRWPSASASVRARRQTRGSPLRGARGRDHSRPSRSVSQRRKETA